MLMILTTHKAPLTVVINASLTVDCLRCKL
jgi:hypothetical protein